MEKGIGQLVNGVTITPENVVKQEAVTKPVEPIKQEEGTVIVGNVVQDTIVTEQVIEPKPTADEVLNEMVGEDVKPDTGNEEGQKTLAEIELDKVEKEAVEKREKEMDEFIAKETELLSEKKSKESIEGDVLMKDLQDKATKGENVKKSLSEIADRYVSYKTKADYANAKVTSERNFYQAKLDEVSKKNIELEHSGDRKKLDNRTLFYYNQLEEFKKNPNNVELKEKLFKRHLTHASTFFPDFDHNSAIKDLNDRRVNKIKAISETGARPVVGAVVQARVPAKTVLPLGTVTIRK